MTTDDAPEPDGPDKGITSPDGPPDQATTPPANPPVDEDKLADAEEELGQAGGGH